MRALKSVEEAAGLLGISRWTVRSYVRDGKLRPVRLGRRVLFEECELERFVNASRGSEVKILDGDVRNRETDGSNSCRGLGGTLNRIGGVVPIAV